MSSSSELRLRSQPHVVYVDQVEEQRQSFREKFPDIPVFCTDQLPLEVRQETAAVVVDHLVMQQVAHQLPVEPLWFWEPKQHLVTTYSADERTWADYGYRVYRLSDGPLERATVRSLLLEAIRRVDPSYSTPAVRLDQETSAAVSGLVLARESLSGAVSSLKRATGKLYRVSRWTTSR